MPRKITFSIVQGDVITFSADLLALKYARSWHGADQAVAVELAKNGLLSLTEYKLDVGEHKIINARSSIVASEKILFVGVPILHQFRYDEINLFAADVLRIAAEDAPETSHLAMTLHGVGYGLDENASAISQLSGLLKGLAAGAYPPNLQKITLVERNEGRVTRLRAALDAELKARRIPAIKGDEWAYLLPAADPISVSKFAEPTPSATVSASTETPVTESTSAPTAKKHHAFIAMPFRAEMDDIFFYGIQQPVHRLGLLCERADFDNFTGDVMNYVRERIETASVVIADLTGANANVYLEVGYSWGKDRPTILIVSNEKELKFDVQGQRCLVYPSIRKLEEMLEKELSGLIAKGVVKV
ncbi:MAG: hypothetical protein KF726_00830 [Anaerolineae bacterium]|nr:hypothetical protein [Anaerolineae bacterium]